MKKFKFLPLFFLLCLIVSLFCGPAAAAVSDPSVSSPTVLVTDRRSGEVIFSRNADQRIYPASTTKVLTVLLAIEAVEHGDVYLNDAVTASESAMRDLIAEGSTAGIQPGETMTLEQLLYCAMIASANEACNIIAEHISGSIDAFVKLMNERASELGCTASHFVNTHGLPDDQHYITASDYSLIALEAARHPQFMKICGTAEYLVPATNVSAERTLHNSNALICSDSIYGSDYVYEGASGIKTGHTNAAGYCLASTASRNGLDFLVLVFGAPDSDTCFIDSITLFDWAFGNFSYRELLKSTENIASVDIAMGSNVDYVNLRPSSSISALLPNDVDISEFHKDIRVYALENGNPVVAPVAAGEVLGEVTVTRAGQSYGTVKLVASSSVELSRLQYIKSQIRETTQQKNFRIAVVVLGLLLFIYIVWVIIYRIKRIRYLRAVRAAKRARLAAAAQKAAQQAAPPSAPMIEYFSEDPPVDASIPASEPEPEEVSRVIPAPLPEDDPLSDAGFAADPDPFPPARTQEEQAERDYFEEFFRTK